jgi:membrane-associated phospholipid phosphatase
MSFFGLDKKLAYDWMGSNEWLFKQINALDGNATYNSFMVFISSLAEHTNFPYYIGAMAVFCVLQFILRKLRKRAGAGQSLIAWIGVLSVFAASYAVDGLIVKTLKDEFAYPRPYVALDSKDVHVLGETKTGESRHSFPSGHASFATVLVGSVWPMLAGKGPFIGVGLVFLVCWSRIAAGVHFPADVIAGALIGFAVVLVVRFIIYTLYAKIFKWKC